MNVWDTALLALIAAAVAGAIRHIVRAHKRGRSLCGGDCTRCLGPCGFRGGSGQRKR
ncbi:MAG: FeoB-associated Cys-rich membrane protein [Pyramidobacter sp.]|nr:FeoB-associated Cys-rich membrane protein [Pyramidobacter sp.]